jgi:hypothetical protein
MSSYHLAQLNVARLLAPLDSPVLVDFVGNLDRINALAESSPLAATIDDALAKLDHLRSQDALTGSSGSLLDECPAT